MLSKNNKYRKKSANIRAITPKIPKVSQKIQNEGIAREIALQQVVEYNPDPACPQLSTEMRIHKEKYRFYCTFCRKDIHDPPELKLRMKRRGRYPPAKKRFYLCPICGGKLLMGEARMVIPTCDGVTRIKG